MNDPILILEGKRAASWLAMQNYDVGLKSPACYPQGTDGEVVKVNNEVCLARGRKIIKKIEDEWRKQPPKGVILHHPNSRQWPLLKNLFPHSP